MTLFFLLNPKHYGNNDTSDVFRRRVKAYKKKEQQEEEAIAASLLSARLQESLLPQETEPATLASELLAPSNAPGINRLPPERIKRIKMLLILMIADII